MQLKGIRIRRIVIKGGYIMGSNFKYVAIIIMFILLSQISSLQASWILNGTPICTEIGEQWLPRIIPDGAGGAIIVWGDPRDGEDDIYAQRIDGNGNILWSADGSVICNYSGDQGWPEITTDCNGGAIIAWHDSPDIWLGDIYAQRINSSGTAQWTPNGIPITQTISLVEGNHKIAPDSAGGAIITWEIRIYHPEEYTCNIYTQKVNANGSVQWPVNGVAVTNHNNGWLPQICSDGAGGAIIVWVDTSSGDVDIYAQRVDASGDALWTSNGVEICTAVDEQLAPQIIPDGAKGAIIAWCDHRDNEQNIYAQRIDSTGTVKWTANGVAVTTNGSGINPQLCSDGTGGAIITWGNGDISARRVNSSGGAMWMPNGIEICAADGSQTNPMIYQDGDGGAIITWTDERNGNKDIYAQRVNSNGVIQWKVSQWGAALCKEQHEQDYPQIAGIGTGKAIVTWEDHRGSGIGDIDIYAQKVKGTPPETVPICDVSAVIMLGDSVEYELVETFLFGCPSGDRGHGEHEYALVVTCDFDAADAADIDSITPGEIELDTDGLPFSFCDVDDDGTTGKPENNYVVTLILKNICGCSDCPGCEYPHDVPVSYSDFEIGKVESLKVKSIDVTGTGGEADGLVNISELVGLAATYNKARGQDGYNGCYDYNDDWTVNISDLAFLGKHYNHSCPTSAPQYLFANTGESGINVRFVETVENNGDDLAILYVTIYFDNVIGVSATCFGLNNEDPFLEYAGWIPCQYFPGWSEVAPVVNHGCNIIFIAGANMESVHGNSIEFGTLKYRLKGEIKSLKESMNRFSYNLIFGDILYEDGNVKKLSDVEYEHKEVTKYNNHLANNYPNPFNPSTTIKFSVASDSHVNISIYNVNGQLIRTLMDEFKVSNMYAVIWDGKNNDGNLVTSGVYFYQLKTVDCNITKKLVLLR